MVAGQSPKYVSIATKLTQAIESGRYAPGDRLPAESKLAEEYRATVPTVRRAMALLRSQNLIESRQGVGTFVRNLSSQQLPDDEDGFLVGDAPESAHEEMPWPRHLRSIAKVSGSAILCAVYFEGASLTMGRVVRALYTPVGDPLMHKRGRAIEEALSEDEGRGRVYRIARPTDGVEAELLRISPGSPALSIVKPLGKSRILDTVYPGDTLVPGTD